MPVKTEINKFSRSRCLSYLLTYEIYYTWLNVAEQNSLPESNAIKYKLKELITK